MVAEISVAVENFGAAEAATGLFLLDILRKDISELAAMLDIFDFKHRAGLILRVNLYSAKSEELLTKGTLYADVLHSVKENLVFIGVEESLFVDELL